MGTTSEIINRNLISLLKICIISGLRYPPSPSGLSISILTENVYHQVDRDKIGRGVGEGDINNLREGKGKLLMKNQFTTYQLYFDQKHPISYTTITTHMNQKKYRNIFQLTAKRQPFFSDNLFVSFLNPDIYKTV